MVSVKGFTYGLSAKLRYNNSRLVREKQRRPVPAGLSDDFARSHNVRKKSTGKFSEYFF
jgi:hypothetical protein